jgi:GPH family glycoside/pentoside/hexuronide:cation symporter
MVAAMMSATLGTIPWIKSLHRPDSRKHSFFTTVKLMAATLMNRNFATILVSGIFSGIAMEVGTGLSIYLNTYFWELPSSKLLMLALRGLISAPAAAFVTPWLSRKWGKRRLAMRLMAAALALTVAPVGLRLLGVMPPNGSSLLIAILVGGQLFEVFCSAGAVILMASMLADVVEESELSTGRRSEGLLMSAGFTLQKVLGGLRCNRTRYHSGGSWLPAACRSGRHRPASSQTPCAAISACDGYYEPPVDFLPGILPD